MCLYDCVLFLFQAEDGIRDIVRSRGLGDVYKRQLPIAKLNRTPMSGSPDSVTPTLCSIRSEEGIVGLSLIHI